MKTVDMRVFHAEVLDAIDLSPAMRRVVFGGAALRDYESTDVGDEYVRLLFPTQPEQVPALPRVVDGGIDFGSVDVSRLRTYTIRAHDRAAATLTIDFVVHEGGVAAAWAQQAHAGQVVGINSPTPLHDPPADAAWQVLVADAAGMPAAIRIAESSTLPTRLVIEVADPAHRVPVQPRDGLTVRWVTGGNGSAPSALAEVMRSVPGIDATGYTWVAGETRTLRAVRQYLRRELRLPATAYKCVGYWIEQADSWRDRYDALDPETRAHLEGMWSSDRAEEEIQVDYDAELTRLGL